MVYLMQLLSVPLLLCFFFSLPLNAGNTWNLVGLKGEKINVIHHPPISEENAIMVGTDKGIWWFEYGSWWQYGGSTVNKLTLPVYDIKSASTHDMLVVAGNGSDSDGVYMSKLAAIGEPGTLFGFVLQARWPRPTALALSGMDGSCSDKIYVGNIDGVSAGLLCSRKMDTLKALPCPQNPFGVRCASMIVSTLDGRLYAGGNYGTRPIFTGEPAIAQFISGTNELTQVKKLNATAIVEYRSQNEIMVAVATVDSGIQLFKNGAYHLSFSSPSPGEPVLSIVPFATQDFGGGVWTMLVAATPSGVYRQCAPNMNCVWARLGDITGSPCCLEQYQGKTLWAATDSGVYRFDYTTDLQHDNSVMTVQRPRIAAIRQQNGSIRFTITGNIEPDYSLSIYDLQGRCIRNNLQLAREPVAFIGHGIFSYRIQSYNGVVQSGRCMVY
jgi:hypothetical protein